MTKDEALKYWKWHLERAEEWSDPHWEASERKAHKEYISAMRMAIFALNRPRIGRWEQVHDGGPTPGGTPVYDCGYCGGSMHLHGAEYPERKVFCDECGSVNLYPWEKCLEEIEDE